MTNWNESDHPRDPQGSSTGGEWAVAGAAARKAAGLSSDKISFKKRPRTTGLAGVGEPEPSVDVKLDGKIVGEISAPTWQTKDNMWSVNFTVEKEPSAESPSIWKRVWFKKHFESEDEARVFVKKMFTHEFIAEHKVYGIAD